MPERGPITGKIEKLQADGKRVPVAGITVLAERERLGFYGYSRGVSNESGEFRMPTAIPGERYELRIPVLPPGTYIGRVAQGDKNVTNNPFTITASAAPVAILLRSDGGQIDGTLKAANPARSTVLLIPKDRNARHLMRTAHPDSRGVFRIDAITPGDYDLVAVGGRQADEVPSEESLRKSGRVSVSVRAGEKLVLELRMLQL